MNKINKVGASHGGGWVSCGWNLFKPYFGVWILIAVAFILLNILLDMIPSVGTLVSTLVTPGLMAGLLYAASRARQGESPVFGDLFQPFKSERRNNLLILGLAQFGLSMLAFLIMLSGMGPSVMDAMRSGGASVNGSIGEIPLLGLLLGLLVMALMSAAMFYAPALVYFHGVSPTEALLISFKASFHNIGAMNIFGLLLFGLGFLVAVTLGLGLVVFLPVMAGAVYCSFRDVFNDDSVDQGVMVS